MSALTGIETRLVRAGEPPMARKRRRGVSHVPRRLVDARALADVVIWWRTIPSTKPQSPMPTRMNGD
jgi:hypothetical protein